MACHAAQGADEPLLGLTLGACAAVLDAPSSGVCCTQARLDSLDASAQDWAIGRSVDCYNAYLRFNCAIECSTRMAQWWDAQINRAHLCPDFCSELWTQCYAVGAEDATAWYLKSEAAFCQFNTGDARSNSSACLGQLPSSSGGGGSGSGNVVSSTGTTSLLAVLHRPPLRPTHTRSDRPDHDVAGAAAAAAAARRPPRNLGRLCAMIGARMHA